jgi:AcrR family transcriptional regulator
LDPHSEQIQGKQRRQANQARAREKVELIFDAATRILDKPGLVGLTTNHIAEVAGISIGTLYQYFANKQEVLDALAQREVAAMLQKLQAALSARGQQVGDAEQASEAWARLLVRTFLSAFGGRHRVRKILLEMGLARRKRKTEGATDATAGSDHGASAPALEVMQWLSSGALRDAQGKALHMDPMAAFVLIQAVVGVARAAMAHDERWLASPELEDCLVRLIHGYMRRGK